MLELLKKHFGYDAFRPMQQEIIEHCLRGQDALVLMPTGGGKSLCFQLPALTFDGMTIVVSPLIALMKDQVDALKANGISAAFLNSSLTPAQIAYTEMQASAGRIKLLYLAPERLAIPHVRQFLQTLPIRLFAIDEAHCISEWGHDFRPDYRNLDLLRQYFPGIPIMALTATANVRVRNDIVSHLKLERGRVFQSSFNRPNLTYRVLQKKKSFDQLLAEIRARKDQAIIVYCFSRKGTEKVAADLRANRVNAAAYHAGLSPAERSRVQERFINDQVPVIAATIAFGMGIDKPDVRLVVHMDLPKSVEGYYQETGRAGRDGLPSDCLLFYSSGDRIKHEYFIREIEDVQERERARIQLQEVMRYAETRACRRAFLLNYFGEAWQEKTCLACDVCVPRATVKHEESAHEPSAQFDEELFQKLRALRLRIAMERGLPAYMIFGDKTLQEMARRFPQSTEALSNTFGVGSEKLAQFGTAFLEVIRAHAIPRGIAEQASTPRIIRTKPASVRAPTDTVSATVKFFEQKLSLERIAQERRLSVVTVVQHLETAFDQGATLDTAHIPDPEHMPQITEAIERVGDVRLAPIHQTLNGTVGYDELRLARLLLRTRKKEFPY